MLGYFQCLSSAYSQVCLSGGGREQDGGRDEEGEDSHYTNGVHTVIREYGSTLYTSDSPIELIQIIFAVTC